MLVGRSREIDVIHGLIGDARAGRGRALVLRGAPGIGKSALLEVARRAGRDGGLRILAARGVESESRLAFAALGDVLRPVLARIDEIPDPQRAALRAALALGPPAASDRYAAYAATLSLLGAVAADGAVLILIDDGHWVDPPSREALVFCARRIADEPIAMLVTSREQRARAAPHARGREPRALPARRGGLDGPAGGRDGLRGAAGARRSRARSSTWPAGNPLALVELPAALSGEERAGGVPLPRPLRPGEAIVEAYRRRVESLDPGARRALGVAAVGDGAPTGAIVVALERLGGDTGDLVAAEAAGFLTLDGDVARLRHPLLRPIALELMEPAERRDAHRALAEALDHEQDVEQRAWHLAEAAIGPDDVVAAALEAAATRAAARTGYATAATFLERAATVAPDPLRSGRDLLGAAQLAMAAGDAARGSALLERLWESGPDPSVRAETAHLRGLVTLMTTSTDDAYDLLLREARTARGSDPVVAAEMLATAGLSRAMAGHGHEALRCMQEARQIAHRERRGARPTWPSCWRAP